MPRRSSMPRIVLVALVLSLLVACSANPGTETAAGPTKPTSLPPLDELCIVGADSPFRQPLPPSPGLHPDSDLLVESLIASEHLVISKNQFSMTVFFADASTAREVVQLHCAGAWGLGFDRIVDIPIPPFAEPTQDVDGADRPVEGCGEESSQDNLMTVFDVGQGCAYPNTKSGGPVAPATDSDGITDDPSAIPIGAMIQLDPGLDLDALGLEQLLLHL